MTRIVLALSIVALAARQATAENAADAVRRIDQQWGEAFRTCNLPVMDRILADDLVFIVQNGAVQGKKDQMASVGRCDMKKMNVQPAAIRLYGRTAVVHGTLDYQVEGPRATAGGRLVYGRVYVNQRGTWRMVLHQSTVKP